jgi:uncharacterized membrane protein YecN with MAPEG domain
LILNFHVPIILILLAFCKSLRIFPATPKDTAMELPAMLSITPIYVALLGLFFLPITLRVGSYRLSSKVLIGDGDDAELIRRMRGQGNFVETVPLAVLMLVLMELSGASGTWLHALCTTLLVGRILHYIGLTEIGPAVGRSIGMFATMATYLASAGWLLYHFI